MGYLFLLLTILLESAAVIFMKLSHGFEQKVYGGIAALAYALSFLSLTYALKYLEVGLANAIWAGASTVLVAVAGIFIFKEHLNTIQIVSMILIVLGLVGLNYPKPA
jgi:small multidrug resistance pump